MRKKVGKVGIVGIIVIIIAIICVGNFRKSDENGNFANMGLVCEAKGIVYYNKYEKGIFSVKNGKETQLTDETAYSLNIVENKIYYITIADFNNIVIKSVDIDGQNLKSITTIDTAISKIYVDKEGIYYSTNETGKGIVKIDLNGQNEEILVIENVQDFQLYQKAIYYVNTSNQICKVDTSGKNNIVLSDTEKVKKIQVIDSWIYYYDENENALFRLKKNGKKKELISVLIHNEIYNICGKYVYYFDKENTKIARMQIGKSNRCDDIITLDVSNTKINIAGNELYYLDKSQDEAQTYQMYRVKVNGKKAKNIEY